MTGWCPKRATVLKRLREANLCVGSGSSTRCSPCEKCNFWSARLSIKQISGKCWCGIFFVFFFLSTNWKMNPLWTYQECELKLNLQYFLWFCKMRSICDMTDDFIHTGLQSQACTHVSISCPNGTWVIARHDRVTMEQETPVHMHVFSCQTAAFINNYWSAC